MIQRRSTRTPDNPRYGRMEFYFLRRAGQPERLILVRHYLRRPI